VTGRYSFELRFWSRPLRVFAEMKILISAKSAGQEI
jgi:hypothetical protein